MKSISGGLVPRPIAVQHARIPQEEITGANMCADAILENRVIRRDSTSVLVRGA